MRHNRLRDVEQYIIDNETVSLEEISSYFKISMSTVRRDINTLLNKGSFYKVYGGVSALRHDIFPSYLQRTESKHTEKDAIAKKAAQIIEDEDVIFIDSGTTTYHIVKHIAPTINVTIITASVSAIIDGVNLPNLRIISLPGELYRSTNSFCGLYTADFLDNYNINKAFLAAVGVSAGGDITNASTLEYDIKLKAMQKSKDKILLIDNEKFNVVSLLSYAKITDFDCIYIDAPVDENFAKLCKESKVKLNEVKI